GRRRGVRRGLRRDRVGRLALSAAARAARSSGLRLALQRRLEPDAVVPPALPLGAGAGAEREQGPPPRVGRGVRGREPWLRGRRRRRARARARGDGLLPRLPPLPGASNGARRAV